MIYHKWYKGEQECYGNYIYRDDECDCGCIRRTVLDDQDKEEIEGYTIDGWVSIKEPECTRSIRKVYRTFKRIIHG